MIFGGDSSSPRDFMETKKRMLTIVSADKLTKRFLKLFKQQKLLTQSPTSQEENWQMSSFVILLMLIKCARV